MSKIFACLKRINTSRKQINNIKEREKLEGSSLQLQKELDIAINDYKINISEYNNLKYNQKIFL